MAHVTEFAGNTYGRLLHQERHLKNNTYEHFDIQKDRYMNLLIGHDRRLANRFFYQNSTHYIYPPL